MGMPKSARPFSIPFLIVSTLQAGMLDVEALQPKVIVSEVLASPLFLPAEIGEYLELWDLEERPLSGRGLQVKMSEKSLNVDSALLLAEPIPELETQSFLLLCRDLAAARAKGLPCAASFLPLVLGDEQPLILQLCEKGLCETWIVPKAHRGVAWENTWDASQGYMHFALALQQGKADAGSPGSKSRLRAQTHQVTRELELSVEPRRLRLGEIMKVNWNIPASLKTGPQGIEIWVHDREGKKVMSIAPLSFGMGFQGQWHWTGIDAQGQTLSPGPYGLLLKAGGRQARLSVLWLL